MSARRPLRIVFVIASRRWTGGERCMTAVARGLAARGHAVAVAYDPRGPAGDRLGGAVRAVPIRVRNDLDPVAIGRIRRLIRRHAASVVCVNTVREARVGGAAARLAGRGRVVRRFGGMDPLHSDLRSRAIYRLLLDAVVRDCDWSVRRVREANPWFRGPILRGRNGVDTRRLAALEPASGAELGAEDGEVRVAALGRVERRKGAHDLAAAAAGIGAGASAGPPVRLVYIGSPDPGIASAIRRRAAAANGRVRVSLLGWREPEEALRLVKACDLLAHPTRADSLSYAVLEALALELPVIAADVGGLREAVVHGRTGLRVPPRDVPALTDALGTLVRDPGLRERMGAAARRRAEHLFDERIMLDEYEAAFRRVARRDGRATEER